MPRTKSHKGLLKRVRITKSGKVKLSRACARHLKSHKSSKRIRQYRRPNYATSAEMNRLRQMLNRRIRSAEDAERAKAEQD